MNYRFVVFTGTFALSIQFFFTPKYALNTYALIPDSLDFWWMQIIFCLHECMFMYHAYAYQACTMVVAESKSTSYQHLLEEMTKAVYKLIEVGENRSYAQRESPILPSRKETTLEELAEMTTAPSVNSRGFKPRESISEDNGVTEGDKSNGTTEGRLSADKKTQIQKPKKVRRSAYRRQIMDDGGGLGSGNHHKQARRRYLNPKTKAPGTDYDIETLIRDYRKIMIASNEHNKWIGKMMGGAQAANYAQFVSDVFMMIQVNFSIKPDTTVKNLNEES
jgi:hypothetical protein